MCGFCFMDKLRGETTNGSLPCGQSVIIISFIISLFY